MATNPVATRLICTFLVIGAATGAHAAGGSSRIDIDTIEQSTPPGAVNQEQILIIENDAFGNQRTLRIGHPGGTVTRPKPCTLEDPGPGMDCTGRDLRAARWDGLDLAGARFDDADLRGASLRGAVLVNATFNNARLDGADLRGADLTNCDFNSASLLDTRLSQARLINTSFMDAALQGADLSGASMINTEFMAARLDGTVWADGHRCGPASEGECLR